MAENLITEQRITDLERRMSNQEETTREIKGDVKDLDKRVDQQDRLMERVEVTISGMERTMNGMDQKLDKFIEKQEQEKAAAQAAEIQQAQTQTNEFKRIAFELAKWILIGLATLAGLKGAADWLGILPGIFK